MNDRQETFLDDVRSNVERGPKCSVSMLIKDLEANNPGLAKQVVLALNEKAAYQTSAIARELKKRGYDISGTTVGRHRRNQCSCDRDNA